jgi:hypothetical protein
MALMSGHHIDFVALDLPFQHDRRATLDDPLTELADHRPGVVFVDVQLLGDLQSREVQPHEIQAGDPGPKRLVVAGEDGVGQVVEALTAALAFVALAMSLGVIPAVLDERIRTAVRTGYAVGPTHLPDGLVALGVVEQVLDVHHRSTPRVPDGGVGRADEEPDGSGRL